MSLDDLEKQMYKFRNEKGGKKVTPPSLPKEPEHKEEFPSHEWSNEVPKEKPKSFFKRTLLIFVSFAVFAGIALLAVFLVFRGGGSLSGVKVEAYGPENIYRGVPFEVSLQISNDVNTPMEDAELVIKLTSGLITLDNPNNESMVIDSLGSLGGGSFTRKTYKFFSSGDLNSVQKIDVKLSYGSGGGRYETQAIKEISIKNPAISLEIKKPEQLVQGSTFTFEIQYENDSNFDFPEVILEAKYPNSFSFTSSSISPSSLDNLWRLGELKSGSKGSLQVEGVFRASEGDRFNVPVSVSASILGKEYPILEKNADFSISPSPIKMEVFVNGKDDYIARVGEDLTYTIKYQNLSGIALADVVIKTSFLSEAFDFSSLSTEGSFNSLSNSITWTASKIPQLRLLDPGASGEVRAKMKVSPSVLSPERPGDKDYVLKTETRIDSPSVPYYISGNKTSAVVSSEVKLTGQAKIETQAFYRDPDSGIANMGSIPPKVNEATEYTVHWRVKNYITDLEDVEISAFFGSGVEMTGIVKSNTDTVPVYNNRTDEVVWKIKKIPATKGVLDAPYEAIFQVRAVPNTLDVGRYQKLLGETKLKAKDGFTGLEITAAYPEITTLLPNDTTISSSAGKVIR